MGDCFRRWINLGKKADQSKPPRIFYVNWFRKTTDGKWLWPEFSKNRREFERCAGTIGTEKTAIGYRPRADNIDLNGLEEEEIAGA